LRTDPSNAPRGAGTRFVDTRTWTIDVNDWGSHYYDVYHVVSSTPKSLELLQATLVEGEAAWQLAPLPID
jgi:hypothetical protein